MAQKVSIELVDDLNGKEADETVTFALDGTTYEIDLSTKNAEKLRKALDPFVTSARKSRGRASARAPRSRMTSADGTAAEVRAWARSSGYDVPARGRIPANIREAFEAAT